MNYDILLAVIFYVILYGLFFTFKKRFTLQGRFFIMYKTKIGLKLMDKIASKDKKKNLLSGFGFLVLGIILIVLGIYLANTYFVGSGAVLVLLSLILIIPFRFIGDFANFIGFVGMFFMLGFLVKGVIDMIISPSSPPVVSPVLPGVEVIPGLPIMGFWHWILAILIMAVIHEFSHGIYARLYKIKIKSSGFALLGPLLAAFVEPNEKQMSKKKARKKLHVLSAGPFSNIYTAIIFLVVNLFILAPLAVSGLSVEGLQVQSIDPNYPINDSGLFVGEVITSINGVDMVDLNLLSSTIFNSSSGESINLSNENSSYSVLLGSSPLNESLAYMGISVVPYYGDSFSFWNEFWSWISQLFFWLYVISLGVGLFNLLPLGPVDGGRMLHVISLKIFKKEKIASRIWRFFSSVCLLLIIINLLPWVFKLFSWIF